MTIDATTPSNGTPESKYTGIQGPNRGGSLQIELGHMRQKATIQRDDTNQAYQLKLPNIKVQGVKNESLPVSRAHSNLNSERHSLVKKPSEVFKHHKNSYAKPSVIKGNVLFTQKSKRGPLLRHDSSDLSSLPENPSMLKLKHNNIPIKAGNAPLKSQRKIEQDFEMQETPTGRIIKES